jgi:hypothetical protein
VRNAFYGVPISEILHPRGLARVWTAHFVIDETTAMAVAQATPQARRYAFWATGLILFTLWQLGSLTGALIGRAIDPSAVGLDAAAPAFRLCCGRCCGVERRAGSPLGGAAVRWRWFLAPPGVPSLRLRGALVAGMLPRRTEPVRTGAVTPLWWAIIVALSAATLKLAGCRCGVDLEPSQGAASCTVPAHCHAVRLGGGGASTMAAAARSTGAPRRSHSWGHRLLLRRGFLVVFLVAIGVTALLAANHLTRRRRNRAAAQPASEDEPSSTGMMAKNARSTRTRGRAALAEWRRARLAGCREPRGKVTGRR